MNLQEITSNALNQFVRFYETNGGVAVTTHCMYPSNNLVRVLVCGGGDSFVVTDNGGTMFELRTSGVPVQSARLKMHNFLGNRGLMFDQGVITSESVSSDFLPTMILMVANASSELAYWTLANAKWKPQRAFKEVVRELLEQTFVLNQPREVEILGASKKRHKFENVIELSTGRRLIVDAVVHDASSINSRVVANIDIHNANIDGLDQRIVYDDEDEWPVADLTLLKIGGAAVVPFSKSRSVMERFAANG